MANPPRSIAENDARAPDSFPMGVRAPATMTEPGMWRPPSFLRGCQLTCYVERSSYRRVAFAFMPRTVRAFCITAEAVARERERVGGDPKDMDVSRVVELDKLELRVVGSRDVHM